MIAALPMYDRPELRAATDRLWAGVATGLHAFGIEAPAALARGDDPWSVWESSDLVLAQTCGLPYRSRLHEITTLVATPDYGLPDCEPGTYCSVVVSASEPPAEGARLAFNEGRSQSGWAAALDWLEEAGLSPGALLETGGHANSLRAVAEGRADLAALDAVTWRLLQRYEPAAAEVRVIARTRATPGLPLITARGRDPAPLSAAVESAIATLRPADRTALGLTGLVRLREADYLALPIPTAPADLAANLGIPLL